MRLMPMLALATLAVPAIVVAQQQAAPAPAQPRPGYLAPGSFDILKILAPAPTPGTPDYANDRKVFAAMKKWKGTPRWDMATADVPTDTASMLKDFSCSVGIALTPQLAPRTAAVLIKAGNDTNNASVAAKNHYQRLRPFQVDKVPAGDTCQAPDSLNGSYDYPSGHTIKGWTWGQLLSEAVPDRAVEIMARARAYGQSRLVCRVHNASAVDGGVLTASATLAAVHASAAFRDDIAAARVELAALRADPKTPKPEGCEAEAALVAQPIY